MVSFFEVAHAATSVSSASRNALGRKTDVRHYISFFGDQEGDFSIVFNSVAVEKTEKSRDASIDSVAAAKAVRDGQHHGDGGASKGSTLTYWMGRLCGWGR